MDVNDQVKAELTPTGKLRAAINLSNFLLVTGKAANGDPEGVSPDMAAEVARRLGVELELVPYPNPGALEDWRGDLNPTSRSETTAMVEPAVAEAIRAR